MTFLKKDHIREPQKDLREYKKKINNRMTISTFIGLLIGFITFLFNKEPLISIIIGLISTVLFFLNLHFREQLKKTSRLNKIEDVFPDFLQLMSSNLRAGITIDKAMLLSARGEFGQLDKEIQKTGRDIATGKNIEKALLDMSDRIGSEKIAKTISLIISGINSGGNVATLLEETAVNTREKAFIEKRAASNVLMYVIFIFIAVAVGAPALFGLSGLLVEILTTILSGLPAVESTNVPFAMSNINISTDFILYFSLAFIVLTDILASLVLGLVSKGEEKQGLKYLPPILLISLGVFFIVKLSLSSVVKGFFA